MADNNLKGRYNPIFLDLDGTVTDPMEGITRSVQYALSHFGIRVDNREELCPFIGPPLKDSFREFYHFTNAQADQAILEYRRYFSKQGIFENKVYPDMEELLQHLSGQGQKLILATSKPEVFARRILDHFGLSSYFTFVGGSTLDGQRSTKTEVIRYILEQQHLTDLSTTVMVGDRKYDIEGARNNGIHSIGVTYGYGTENELRQAGANYIAATIPELKALLTA